jgi:hypothetical protein
VTTNEAFASATVLFVKIVAVFSFVPAFAFEDIPVAMLPMPGERVVILSIVGVSTFTFVATVGLAVDGAPGQPGPGAGAEPVLLKLVTF